MERLKILVVDDESRMRKLIKDFLVKSGYEVIEAENGEQAVDLFLGIKDIALMILDVMMPKMDGLSAMMKIRTMKNIPIIVLSAKSEDSDKILGLSMGADDYITKPYNPMELVARVQSNLRRYLSLGAADSVKKSSVLRIGGLSLDRDEKQIYIDGEPVKLTATEYKITELLMENAGRVFSAEEIYSRVWNEDSYSVENTVMVHIRHIREKIEINPAEPRYLKVVWGIGYKISRE
mgnify:CR=1 FL=1